MTAVAVAVLRFADLQVVESALARRPTAFSYGPGLLSFHEIPALLEALTALVCTPDLLLAAGQGLAHPQRFGLACHLGWPLDTPRPSASPSPGCRVSSRCLRISAGAWSPLLDQGDLVGAAVRTRSGRSSSPQRTASTWRPRCA